MKEELLKYRADLITGRQKAQEQFDKAVLTLSGGALGISFAFVDKFVPKGSVVEHSNLLIIAWSCWGTSIMGALLAYYLSPIAFNKAIKQVDEDTIYDSHPGGFPDKITGVCNFLSSILFLIGVVFIIIFVSYNYGGNNG
ncbi:MAG: hypothetical protein IIB95_00700 [Candidatus Marinimicrobia bacterium]|nr:hypothetical protein [Candidatus Neomarinimicrobiota bacterium]